MLTETHSWNSLPLVVICHILNFLKTSDRLTVTATCRHWRSGLWQPSFWRTVRFRLLNNYEQLKGWRQLAERCGQFIREATFEFDSGSSVVVGEMLRVLDTLGANIQKIVLKPYSCQIAWPNVDSNTGDAIELFVKSLEDVICKSYNFKHLSLGCISEFTDQSNRLLSKLQNTSSASGLEVLHIASIKEDPKLYPVCKVCPDLLVSFRNLHTLSIDYDHLNEKVLHNFVSCGKTSLRKLIIHVHDAQPSHEQISDSCWRHLALAAGNMEVTLNLIHSRYGSDNLLQLISPEMPLVHFRALFCGHLDVAAINYLGQHMGKKLQSFLVVDGMDGINAPNRVVELDEDPFVMLAWKCSSLVNFTLIGYEISDESIIAIARLRGQQLRLLDIPHCCIVPNYEELSAEDFINEVSVSLGRRWEPLSDDNLHEAVISETVDTETFYLNILLSDQD